MSTDARSLWLLVRAGSQLCAVPVDHVGETMRLQTVRAVAGVPEFILGLAVIRGVPTPVIDAASVLGASTQQSHAACFVTLKTADRRIALAVDQVVGVRELDRRQLSDLPPLLAGAQERALSAIGTLDGELMMVLRSGLRVPEAIWTRIQRGNIP